MLSSSLWKFLVTLLAFFAGIACAQPQPDHLQVTTIRNAYKELGEQVTQAIRIQLGDLSQIHQQQASAQAFLLSVNQVNTHTVIDKVDKVQPIFI